MTRLADVTAERDRLRAAFVEFYDAHHCQKNACRACNAAEAALWPRAGARLTRLLRTERPGHAYFAVQSAFAEARASVALDGQTHYVGDGCPGGHREKRPTAHRGCKTCGGAGRVFGGDFDHEGKPCPGPKPKAKRKRKRRKRG